MLTAKAIQLCAASVVAAAPLPPATFHVDVLSGAALIRQPENREDGEATVRDLLTRNATFAAGPLAIHGEDFVKFGVTPESVFDPCALAHQGKPDAAIDPTLDNVVTILRNALDARITDTVRPQNASYGALHSWHKVGQAVDFVPRAGLQSVNRDQIRTLFAAHSIRLLELLGPGDPGHANHWHVAFATEQQDPNDDRPLLRDENWIVTADARGSAPANIPGTEAPAAPASASQPAKQAPPSWDVFASAEWRASHGVGS